MARIWQLQSSFNRGELDPRLVGRKDLQAYYAGALQAQNVVTQVQGGVRRRNGTEHLSSGAEGEIFNFSFSTEVNYCLLFEDLKIFIFKDGVLQTNINGSGDDFLTSPYTLAQVQDLDYIQSADTALLFQDEVQPRVLSRTSDTEWSLDLIDFQNIPQFDFNDALSPAPTSEFQRVTFNSYVAGDRYKISLEGILTDEIVFANDDQANITNIRNALVALPNTAGEGTILVSVNASPNVFNVVFQNGSAKDWDLLSVTPVFTANAAFSATVTQIVQGSARAEDVWSATRGWPRTAVFHEARLWLGGTRSRPSTLWGSKVNFFFDFNGGQARDDEGIDVTLDSDQVNAITAVFSNRTLQVFTTGGEFSVDQSPITPENVAVLPQTNFGAKKVRPITIDGVTIYIQRTGKAVRSFFFVDETKAFTSGSESVLASHLIDDPIDLAASRGTQEIDANYVYIVNTDGTMAVYNTLLAEDVKGFTQWITEGVIVSIAVVDDLLYMLVRREAGGIPYYSLEREDPRLTTDASAFDTNTDTLTGLAHLEGDVIDVIADGAYKGEFLVVGGQVTIDRQAEFIYGGLNYTPVIETMPLNVPLQNGPNAALPKRIVRAALELFESNSVLVNGERIANKTLGVNVFEPPSPVTGLKEMYLLGWDVSSTLTITQEEPMPMNILAAYLEISS